MALRVLVFGASGMLGQALLRECALDSDVQEVKTVGRAPLKFTQPKMKQLISTDLFHLENYKTELTGYDACFFCLGASAAGLSEEQYARINYELPLAVANLLVKLNKSMVFIYVSGAGTDNTAKGPVMWARVKGRTENDLMKLPFKASYMFRPAVIIPKHGESSKTPLYRYFYMLTKPFYFFLEKLPSKYVINTEDIGRAMLNVSKSGTGNRVLESSAIKQASKGI